MRRYSTAQNDFFFLKLIKLFHTSKMIHTKGAKKPHLIHTLLELGPDCFFYEVFISSVAPPLQKAPFKQIRNQRRKYNWTEILTNMS